MEKTENHGTPENAKKGEKGEKNEFGFIGYLMGGFILVSIGIFTLLDLTNPKTSNQDLAGMLVTIGAIIIVGGVYMAITLRKRLSSATAT